MASSIRFIGRSHSPPWRQSIRFPLLCAEIGDMRRLPAFPVAALSAYRRAHAEHHLQDLPETLWRAAAKAGRFDGAPIDLADGFIHFSTAEQVRETAAKHFAGQTRLAARRRRCRTARRRAEIRGLARRRAVPASLRPARSVGGALGQAAAARRRRHPCLSGGPRMMLGLLERLGRQALFCLRSRRPRTACRSRR